MSHSVECSTIMIFMTGCGRVVNYRSMKFLYTSSIRMINEGVSIGF